SAADLTDRPARNATALLGYFPGARRRQVQERYERQSTQQTQTNPIVKSPPLPRTPGPRLDLRPIDGGSGTPNRVATDKDRGRWRRQITRKTPQRSSTFWPGCSCPSSTSMNACC